MNYILMILLFVLYEEYMNGGLNLKNFKRKVGDFVRLQEKNNGQGEQKEQQQNVKIQYVQEDVKIQYVEYDPQQQKLLSQEQSYKQQQYIIIEDDLQILQTQIYSYQNQTICSICLQQQVDIRLLKCNHYFHQQCIQKWYRINQSRHQTCPVCRQSMMKIQLTQRNLLQVIIKYFRVCFRRIGVFLVFYVFDILIDLVFLAIKLGFLWVKNIVEEWVGLGEEL